MFKELQTSKPLSVSSVLVIVLMFKELQTSKPLCVSSVFMIV